MVMAATNQALEKAQDMASTRMGALTGGLNIPGLTVVVADYRIAPAPITDECSVAEIIPADDDHDQVAAGHTD